jgi:cation diffusion facilitator CzcD-associated flavoprotein CzcO
VTDFDVIIIGAGISGISAAYHLQHESGDRTFTILEARSDLGGTWDLFRYPGVRSDSDMHTLGFGFRPWSSTTSIAEGHEILEYLRTTAREHHIDERIRFNHRLLAAAWDSTTAHWVLTIDHAGDEVVYRCRFLMVCAGYYSYRAGHTPAFPGSDSFTGPIIHPQQWPEDLEVSGRHVTVIGSGATAITLVPALADLGAQVTMLQRSPTYVVSRPRSDRVAARLRRLVGETWAQRITRAKNIRLQRFTYRTSQRKPDKVRSLLVEGARKALDPSIDVDTHFSPTYDPWTQRLCLIPDGDLFRVLNSRQAEVITGDIESFTEHGIALVSGEHIDTDIIVTATGLELVTLAEAEFSIDGTPVDFSAAWTYRGLAYSGVPNLVSTFGYIAASWTLRADLISQYTCRVLNHLRDSGTDIATPTLRPTDLDMPRRPWIDDFSPGYLQRMMPRLPAQGDREPWTNPQDYRIERQTLTKDPIDDGVMRFESVHPHR